jgi:hypothetical protein
MHVEIFYFDGCPTWQRAVELVRAILSETRRDADLRLVRLETDDEARRLRFLGSPTIRVNGRDVDPTVDQGGEFGLQCRLYRDGDRLTGLPPAAWVRAALVEPPPDGGFTSSTISGGKRCP